MAKNAKVIIATAVVVALSALLAFSEMVIAGACLLVAGLAGIAFLRLRQDDKTIVGGKSKLDRALEARSSPAADDVPATPPPATAPPATAPPAASALPTWSPSHRPAVTGEPRVPQAPADSPAPASPGIEEGRRPRRSAWDVWQDDRSERAGDALDEENPLAALDRLDEIDPIAEVERLEGLSSHGAVATSNVFSFSSAPKVINEAAVHSDDDIMAASHATELHVSDGDSELARLLAKVHERLAAYE